MNVFIVIRSEYVGTDYGGYIDVTKGVFTAKDKAEAFVNNEYEKLYSEIASEVRKYDGCYDEDTIEYIINERLSPIGYYVLKCVLDDPEAGIQTVVPFR